MPHDLTHLSIAEIERRYLRGDEPVTARVLAALQRDPRAGAQRIHGTLRKRQERQKEEERRLDSMLNFARVLSKTGLTRIAGVDEAGVGPLAGPVVAAAVVFPPELLEPEGGLRGPLAEVDDSKRISDPERRDAIAEAIREAAADWSVGIAEVEDVDRLNVYHAAMLAMRRAIEGLTEPPQHLLLDAREIADLEIPQNRFDQGDGLDFSIAAASILAKTHRDRLMIELDRRYPEYGFARHKGYGTPEHQEAIRRHGPCAIHRRSFGVIDELCGALSDRFYELRDRLDDEQTRDRLTAFEEALSDHRQDLSDDEHRKLRLLLRRRWRRV